MKLKSQASKEKLRGGFYTPIPIAEFILKWGTKSINNAKILEPSCGDGNFLKSLQNLNLNYGSITAIEFDEIEFNKAKKIELENSSVINTDFHKFCINTKDKYDLIVGNPPYIRYQFFEKEQQELAEMIYSNSNLKYSKLANAWVSFVVGSTQLLNKEGKIGFVLPAEILQVSYAKQLRLFLAKEYNKINIISFKKLVFEDIQQEVVLLLCEKDLTNEHKIDHIELNDAKDLIDIDLESLETPQKRIDFNSNKWTYYFLEQEEIDFLENIAKKRGLKSLGEFAKVEVGITTGANPYFTISKDVVNDYALSNYCVPMVGRSVQVSSAIFTYNDWLKNFENIKVKSSLIAFPEVNEKELEVGAQEYIKFGVDNEINKGYKTSIRKFWYCIPSLRTSDALFIRRNNIYPKLIINSANAYTTDTMHRVTILEGVSINALVASYYNSLSFAFAEVSGRSHGGGVLELMPNEAENILLPYNKENESLISEIDKMIRDGIEIQDLLNYTNNITLKYRFGFTDKEIEIANNIWIKLRDRRLNRN
ncbi:class I SAM-dependent methyltransferase [Empedobacter falsenii]